MTSKRTRKPKVYTVASLLRERLPRRPNVFEQQRIARLLELKGYSFVELIMDGKIKLSVDRTQLTAAALGVDPVEFFRLVLEQYGTREDYQVIYSRMITENERVLIERFRELTHNTDPKFTEVLDAFFRRVLEPWIEGRAE